MSDILLDFLNTLAITHAYLSYDVTDIPVIHFAVTKYTDSPNVLHKYSNSKIKSEFDSLKYEKVEILSISNTKSDNLNKNYKIKLYILQLRLEIIMSEFILAAGTVSRLKDLFGNLNVNEEIGPLLSIITLRSELLETEAYIQYETLKESETQKAIDKEKKEFKDNNNNSQFDKLADIKNVVNNYIDSSTKIVLDSINRTAILSVTSSGSESLRDPIDLYLINKRKSSIDKNIANFSTLIKSTSNNIILNPVIAINESIHAINDLSILRPLDIENYIELSNIYLLNGKLKEALWCVGNALLLGCSGAWNIWSLRGEICLLQSKCISKTNSNDLDSIKSWLFAAIASFSHSIELCDDFVRAWCGLFVSLNRLKNLKSYKLSEIHEKLIKISNEKLEILKIDDSIQIQERENINWILANKI
jgi:hypothetical protein